MDNGHLPSLTFKYNQTLVYGKLGSCGLMQSSVIRGLHQLPSQCSRVHNKSEVSLFSRGEGQKSPSPLFFFLNSLCVWAVAVRRTSCHWSGCFPVPSSRCGAGTEIDDLVETQPASSTRYKGATAEQKQPALPSPASSQPGSVLGERHHPECTEGEA